MQTKVADVMIREVKMVDVQDSVLDAAGIMKQYEIGCVIVTDEGKPAGILTERDILSRVVFERKDPAETGIKEVMSTPLVTVSSRVGITRATRIMLKKGIKKLVVTNSGRLKGILSLTDLVPLLETQGGINGLPLDEAPKRVRRVFEIYYDPVRQIRKRCPLTMIRGASISCIGTKCMWYVKESCVILNLFQKIS